MQAQARTRGWSSPPAAQLPRDAQEETRSRRTDRSDARCLSQRPYQGIGNAHQFPAGAEAERALMRAILVDAIRCLAGEVSPLAERAQLAAQARLWVRNRDERWPFSFENVCAALDLQTSLLRTLLLASPGLLRRLCSSLVARLAP